MTDELRAAVAIFEAGPDVHSDGFEYFQAVGTLARAYLAEHPADGDEPVTEEWLRSIGFRNLSATMIYLRIPSHDGNGEEVDLYFYSDCVPPITPALIQKGCGKEDHVVLTGAVITTRGQVRRLIEALGGEK